MTNYDFWNNLQYCPVCPDPAPLLYGDGSCPKCKYPNHASKKENEPAPPPVTGADLPIPEGLSPTAKIDAMIAQGETKKIQRMAASVIESERREGITRPRAEVEEEVRERLKNPNWTRPVKPLTELERMTVLIMVERKRAVINDNLPVHDENLLADILDAAEIPIGMVDKARVIPAVNKKIGEKHAVVDSRIW